jgi:peptidoglycan/LPS O-acetylase OafA/YrhL
MSSERRSVLPNLTSIRIFAALYVLLYHKFGAPHWAPIHHWYEHWLNAGILGVSLFFVLSGFILAYTARETISKPRFYALRFARIYPLYFATALITLPNFWRHPAYPRLPVLTADLFLVQSWFGPDFATQLNAPSWSLSTEAFFYLVFPFFLPLARGWMARRKTALGLLAVLAVLPPALTHLWLWQHGQEMSPGLNTFLALPVLRLCEFLIGMIFGLAFLEDKPEPRTRLVFLAALVAVGLCGLQDALPFEVVRNGLLALPFGWLLYLMAGWRSRIFGSRIMQLAGEISYGVYLLQVPVSLACGVIARHLGLTISVENTLVFLSILPIAYLFFRFVEKPGRIFLLKLLHLHSHADPIPRTAGTA